MKKYGGSDSRLTWAELSAGLVKDGKSPAEVAKYHRHWVKATTFLNLERSANYWKLDTNQLNMVMKQFANKSSDVVDPPTNAQQKAATPTPPPKKPTTTTKPVVKKTTPKAQPKKPSAAKLSEYDLSVKEGLKVLKYTNEFRARYGKKPVQIWNKDLHDQCLDHSKEMARVGRISHDKFSHRISNMRKKGYKVYGAAENVAYNWGGSDPARKAVD